jgi:hypothetical protein
VLQCEAPSVGPIELSLGSNSRHVFHPWSHRFTRETEVREVIGSGQDSIPGELISPGAVPS